MHGLEESRASHCRTLNYHVTSNINKPSLKKIDNTKLPAFKKMQVIEYQKQEHDGSKFKNIHKLPFIAYEKFVDAGRRGAQRILG